MNYYIYMYENKMSKAHIGQGRPSPNKGKPWSEARRNAQKKKGD